VLLNNVYSWNTAELSSLQHQRIKLRVKILKGVVVVDGVIKKRCFFDHSRNYLLLRDLELVFRVKDSLDVWELLCVCLCSCLLL
jgi:hypothetical protein